jgi:hypothetical protein
MDFATLWGVLAKRSGRAAGLPAVGGVHRARLDIETLEARALPSATLIAAYGFNEGQGTVLTDASGHGNNGTISGASWSGTAKFGKSLSFNGTSSMVSIANSSSLDLGAGMTVEAWVLPSSLSGWRTILEKDTSGSGQSYSLFASNGSSTSGSSKPMVWVTSGGSEYGAGSATKISTGSWIHVAATFDGHTFRFYINGNLAGSQSFTGSLDLSNNPLCIGGNPVWGQFFKGNIDEVRVYNGAISQSQIQTDMNTPVGSGTSSATGGSSTSSTLTITPAALANATANSAYSTTVSAAGGSGRYTYAVTAGNVPTWLALNAGTGVLSGTPTTTGSSSFTITATDKANTSLKASQAYTLAVNAAGALAVSPSTLASATVNSAYNATVSATGGSGTYTYAVTAGSLPTGLSLNAGSGVLGGTPSAAGSSSFTVTATDSANASLTGSKAYTLTVYSNTLTVNPASLPAATANSAYSATVSATDGSGTYTYAVTAGTLPAWLTLNANTGALSGTPTLSGSASFTITATDSASTTRVGSQAFTLTINAAGTLTVSPTSVPNGTVGTAYSVTPSATGGSGSYTFSVTAGTLPSGLSLNAGTGALSGTPSGTGTFNFTLTATDSANSSLTGSRAYTLTVNPAGQNFVLQNFDGSSVPVNGDGSYPDEYGGSGNATLSLDSTNAVSGKSLDVHLTSGRLTLEFNPYNYSGVPGFPDNRGFARDYGLNPSQWQYNTYDRMSFWVWMPTSDTSYVTDGSHDIEFGTYVKQLTNPDNTSDEAGGTHYYHELNIPNLGVWTQVILNMHPDHQRNDPGSVDPGVIAYPTSPAGGNGGTDPASTYNYFDTLTRFYFDEPYTPPSSYPTDYRFDNIQFYKSAYQENDTQVYSLTGSYQAANNRLVVTWNRDKAEDTVVQEVRYSFTDIHASGWAAATPAPNGLVTPPGGGAYNGMVYDTTQLSLTGHSVVYIAIKPQNSTLFTEIAVPLNMN